MRLAVLTLAWSLFAVAAQFQLADIEKIVQENKPKNSAEFLGHLPENCRRYYNLVYSSRSSQTSSSTSPRILTLCEFYGNRVVLAFADPELNEGKDSVEILAMTPDSRVESMEVTFKDGVANSKKNPGECRDCHGSPLRFLWDEYGYWRNTYNSDHRMVPANSKEWKSYGDYRRQQAKHPLYGQLKPYLETAGDEKQTKDLKYALEKPVQSPAFGELKPGHKYLSATSAFHNQLMEMQFEAVRAHFRTHPQAAVFGFAIAGAELCSTDFEKFFPESWRKKGRSLAAIEKKLSEGAKRYYASVNLARRRAFGNTASEVDSDDYSYGRAQAARQVYLAERMDISPSALFTATNAEWTNLNMTSIFSADELSSATRDAVVAAVSKGWPPGDVRNEKVLAQVCEFLMKASEKALSVVNPPPPAQRPLPKTH